MLKQEKLKKLKNLGGVFQQNNIFKYKHKSAIFDASENKRLDESKREY